MLVELEVQTGESTGVTFAALLEEDVKEETRPHILHRARFLYVDQVLVHAIDVEHAVRKRRASSRQALGTPQMSDVQMHRRGPMWFALVTAIPAGLDRPIGMHWRQIHDRRASFAERKQSAVDEVEGG